MSKKKKTLTASEHVKLQLSQNKTSIIQDKAIDILEQRYGDELKKKFPEITRSELINKLRDDYSSEYNRLTSDIIAPYYGEQLNEVVKLAGNSVVLNNSENIYKSKPNINVNAEKVYGKMDIQKNIFESVSNIISTNKANAALTSYNNTANTNTGSNLISSAIGYDKLSYRYTTAKTSQTLTEFNKSFKFFNSHDKVMMFDLETLGGKDPYGNQVLDAITEFAYTTYDKATGKQETVARVMGITDVQEKEYKALIADVEKNGFTSGRQKVIYERIGLYGHKNTSMSIGTDGFYKVNSVAEVPQNPKYTQSELDRGFAKLRAVQEHQAKLHSPNSLLPAIDVEYAKMIALMQNKQTSVAAYNGTVADLPWINNDLAKRASEYSATQRDEFLEIAGLKTMSIDTHGERFLDPLVGGRLAEKHSGLQSIYKTTNEIQRLADNSPLSQEGITKTFFGQEYANGAAHTAGFDTQLGMKLLIDPSGAGLNNRTFLETVHSAANQNLSKNDGFIRTGNLDLVMATNSSSNGQLNYVYDPVTKQYTTEQALRDGDLGAHAVKRNRLSTVDYAGKMEMSDAWVKDISGTHNELAMKNLYAIKLNPYGDKDITRGNQSMQGHSVMFFKSQDEMEAYMSNFLKIGKRDAEYEKFKELPGAAGEEVRQLLGSNIIKDGKITPVDEEFNLQDIIARQTSADINESAARQVRKSSYKDNEKFKTVYNKLKTYNGGRITHSNVQHIIEDIMNSDTMAISKKLANGETLSISYDDLKNSLGYFFDNKQRLMTATLDNQLGAFNYQVSQMPVHEAIMSELNNHNYSPDEMQYRYQTILNQLIDEESPKVASAVNSGNPKGGLFRVKTKDLDYFEFDIKDLVFNTTDNVVENTFVESKDDILRINLGNQSDYSFINSLLNKTTRNPKNMSVEHKRKESLMQLSSFVKTIQNGHAYGDLFSTIAAEEYTSPALLANAIKRDLIDYRKINPTSGYISSATKDIVTQANDVLTSLSGDKKLTSRIKSKNKNLPTFVVGSSTNDFKTHAANIVNNMLVDNIDPYDYAKALGQDDIKAKYLNLTYNKAKEEYVDYVTAMLENVTKVEGTNVIYDNAQQRIFVRNGNKQNELFLPKIKAQDGNVFLQVGRNNVALHTKLNTSGAITSKGFDVRNVKVNTTLGESMLEAGKKGSFKTIAQKGSDNGDIIERTVRAIQNLNQSARTGASVQYNDILDLETPYRVDITALYDIIPWMKKDGMLDSTIWRDNGFIENIKPNLTFNSSTDAQRQLIQKNIPGLLKILAGQKNAGDDSLLGIIANNYSTTGKETEIAKGVGTVVGIGHRPGLEFQNPSRPVANQTRNTLYRTKDVVNAAVELAKTDRFVGITPLITSEESKKVMNRTIEGVGETLNEIRVGQLSISELEYKKAVAQHFLDKGDLSEADIAIKDFIMKSSLTEQQQILDPLVGYKIFDRVQEQKISASKELAIFDELNESTIKEINKIEKMVPIIEEDIKRNELFFRYNSGVNVRRHEQLLTMLGYSSDYTNMSKFNGTFNQGYFTKTDGILVRDAEINKLLKANNITTKAGALAFLDKTFDKQWYVTPDKLPTYKKTISGGVEKGMTQIFAMGLGSVDKKVSQYISETNGSMLGSVYNQDAINKLLDNFDIDIAKKYGIKNVSDLQGRIENEMSAAFDVLRDIFGKEFSLISNQAEKKHKNDFSAFEKQFSMMQSHLFKSGMTEDEAAKAVFDDLKNVINIKGVYFKDGQIYFPNHISEGDNFDLNELKKVLATDRYSGMDNRVMINGRQVGSLSEVMLSEPRDNANISGKGIEDSNPEVNRLKHLLTNASEEEAPGIKRQISRLEQAIEYNSKGQKVSDRELQLLGAQKYDQGMIDAMSRSLSKEEFEQTFGHVLAKNENGYLMNGKSYVLNNEDYGRSVLRDTIDSYQNTFFRGTDSQLFSTADKKLGKKLQEEYLDDSVREGINTLVNHQGSLSQNAAEHMYSTAKGIDATKFNSGRLNIEQMKERGFHVIAAQDIFDSGNHGINSVTHADSYYDKNIIVDLGKEMTESERYVAVPYTPSKVLGDATIREDFQEKFSSVLRAVDNLDAHHLGEEKYKSKDDLMADLRERTDNLKKSVDLFTVDGKKGNMGTYEVRVDQSVITKSAGLTVIDPDQISKAASSYKGEATKIAGELDDLYAKAVNSFGNTKEAMTFLNNPALSKAQINGKSILEHYSEGKYYNVSLAGEEIFAELGVLSNTFLKNSQYETMDELKHALSTEGILVNATRYPSIYKDSVAPARLYLDSNMQGKQSQSMLEGALARKEDHDGDNTVFSVLKDTDGSNSLDGSGRMWQDLNADMTYRSISSYAHYHDEAYKTMFDDARQAIENGNAFTLTGDHSLDGKIYGAFNIAPTEEAFAKHAGTIDELQNLFQEQQGRRFNLAQADDVNLLSNIIEQSGENRDKYFQAAAFSQSLTLTDLGASAKVRKNAIGEVNNPLARSRRILSIALDDADSARREAMQQIFVDVEQEVISAKKSTNASEYWQKTEEFKTAFNNISSTNAQTRNLGRSQMGEWIDTNVDLAKSSKVISNFIPDDVEDASQYLRNTYIDTLSSLGTRDLQRLDQLEKLGTKITAYGVSNSGNLAEYISDEPNSLRMKALNILRETELIDSQLITKDSILAQQARRVEGNVILNSTTESGVASKNVLTAGAEILQSMSKGISELSASKMGMGVVGLAAAYMLTGYVGSNASTPTDMQAQQINQQSSSSNVSLSDYGNTSTMYNGSTNGYVINVKGSGSPNTIARSQQQLSQSMGNMMNGNINVNMNITESTGNINDRYLDDLIANAVG